MGARPLSAGPWLLLAALPFGFAGPVFFTHSTWFYRDLTYLAYPWRTFVAEELQCGRFPLWNPYAYGGMPSFANAQTAVLSPLSLPFDLFAFPAALPAFTVAALWLLAAAGGLLARRWHAGCWGVVVMGAVASAGGFAVTAIEFPSVLGSFSWLPLVPLLARSSPALAGIAAAMSWLAGYPALGMVSTGAAAFFARGGRGRAVATVLSVTLAAVLLMPMTRLIGESMRWQEGIGYAVSGEGALPVRLWPGVFAPWLVERWRIGLPIQGLWTWWWGGMVATALALYAVVRTAYELPGAAGRLVARTSYELPGAAGRLVARRGRPVIAGLIVFAVALAVAAGRFSPVHAALLRVGAGLLRFPGQAAAAALLAVGWLASRAPLRRRGLGTLAALAVCLELAWLAAGRQPVLSRPVFSIQGALTRAVRANVGEAFGKRFIVSGRAQSALASGGNVTEAWVALQDRLPGLLGTARRIPDAGGFGEPMVFARQARWVSRAFTAPSFDAAKPVLARLGVSAVILPNDSGGVRLVNMEGWPPLFRGQGQRAGVVRMRRPGMIDSIMTVRDAADPVVLNQVYCPGWLAAADGVARRPEPVEALWLGAAVPQHTREVTWVYRPPEFRAGLVVTLAALVWLAARARRRLA